MSVSFIYITCETLQEAENIGTVLVERRLAACVNILDGMKSIYWWQGKMERAEEAVLIAKTCTELVDDLIEAVKAMHGYEVPCIVALPVEGGNRDFLDWIQKETTPS